MMGTKLAAFLRQAGRNLWARGEQLEMKPKTRGLRGSEMKKQTKHHFRHLHQVLVD